MWPYPSKIFTVLSEWLGRLSLFTVCGAAAGFVCWWHHHYSLPAIPLKQRLVQINKLKLHNILKITHGHCILRCAMAWPTSMPIQYILHQVAEPEGSTKNQRQGAEDRWPVYTIAVWGWIKRCYWIVSKCFLPTVCWPLHPVCVRQEQSADL